jgi:hypothetical protein
MRRQAEHVPIEAECGIEVRDGDADMSDAGAIRHATPPTDMVETESTTGE